MINVVQLAYPVVSVLKRLHEMSFFFSILPLFFYVIQYMIILERILRYKYLKVL